VYLSIRFYINYYGIYSVGGVIFPLALISFNLYNLILFPIDIKSLSALVEPPNLSYTDSIGAFLSATAYALIFYVALIYLYSPYGSALTYGLGVGGQPPS